MSHIWIFGGFLISIVAAFTPDKSCYDSVVCSTDSCPDSFTSWSWLVTLFLSISWIWTSIFSAAWVFLVGLFSNVSNMYWLLLSNSCRSSFTLPGVVYWPWTQTRGFDPYCKFLVPSSCFSCFDDRNLVWSKTYWFIFYSSYGVIICVCTTESFGVAFDSPWLDI